MNAEQDKVFFQNYAITIALLGIMIILFLIIARIIGIDDEAISASQANRTFINTAAVGEVRIEGEAGAVAAVEVAVAKADVMAGEPVDLGEKVYQGLCFSCHSTNLPNIPQIGDAAVWATRIEQGMALLYERAIVGFTGAAGIPMPAKGGNPALSDDEVKAAVDYMVANSQ